MLMLLQQRNAIQRCIVKWRTRLRKSKGTPRSITISVSLEPRSHHFFPPIVLLNTAYLSYKFISSYLVPSKSGYQSKNESVQYHDKHSYTEPQEGFEIISNNDVT